MQEGKSPTRTLVFVTALAVILFGVDWFMNGALRSYARTLMQPTVAMTHAVSSNVFRTEFWMTRSALQREIEELKAERARRNDAVAASIAIQQENVLLRSMVRVAESNKGITVPVTSSFSSSPFGTFTIGGGSAQGIHVGDVVIASEGFVLGTVSEVERDTAIVSAVFAPGASVDVTVNDVGFTLSGRGGGNARAEVPREAALSVGDPVLAPSLANRPVGVIGRLESASSSAFSDVFVEFPFNPQLIRLVFVTERL